MRCGRNAQRWPPAVRSREGTNPGVVVHDITMPVLNGIEAARRLKGAAVEARNVFLTVHDDHQDYSGKVMKEVKRAT